MPFGRTRVVVITFDTFSATFSTTAVFGKVHKNWMLTDLAVVVESSAVHLKQLQTSNN